MIELDVDIQPPDGAMNSFVVHPEEGGPFPVVLFYMDPTREGIYHKPSAERHWERLFALFRRNLG